MPGFDSQWSHFKKMVNDILVIALSFIAGYFIDWLWARLVRGFKLEKKKFKKMVFGNIRIHHNVVGYVLVLIGLFYYSMVLIPMGLGMIIGHGRRDRGLYWFVEPLKKSQR